jgi:hypothetical protein
MDPLRQTQKKYGSQAMVAAIVVGLVFILLGQVPVGKGLILGTVFSVINFILIAEALPLRIGKSRAKTFIFSLGSIIFRFALMAIPLVAAVKYDQFNIFATIGGVFMIQIVILGDHLLKILGFRKEQQIQDNM